MAGIGGGGGGGGGAGAAGTGSGGGGGGGMVGGGTLGGVFSIVKGVAVFKLCNSFLISIKSDRTSVSVFLS